MDTAPVAYQSATTLSTPMRPMTIVKPRWGLGSDLTRTQGALRDPGSAVSRRWRGGCKPISTGGLVKSLVRLILAHISGNDEDQVSTAIYGRSSP